jgi:ABC-type lipoprotein export system ATPase subunit
VTERAAADGRVLDVVAVTHAYGDGQDRVVVLDDVTLHADAGEVLCVAGPSGSGKTSLCHLAAGFEAPDSGTVTVAGVSPLTRPDWALVAALPQQHGLLAELSVRQNAELPALRGGHPTPNLDDLLLALDLHELADRAVADTSLGEQQRAALARALVLAPRLVVLDEPTGHQDDDHVSQVLAAVKRAAADGAAVLVASHDDRVLETADRVLRLDRGRLQT